MLKLKLRLRLKLRMTESEDGAAAGALQVITASSDATVRVWDGKSCECVQAFRPPQAGSAELAVNTVLLNPQNLDQLVVCNRSSTVFIMTMQGQARGPFPPIAATGWHEVAEASPLLRFSTALAQEKPDLIRSLPWLPVLPPAAWRSGGCLCL